MSEGSWSSDEIRGTESAWSCSVIMTPCFAVYLYFRTRIIFIANLLIKTTQLYYWFTLMYFPGGILCVGFQEVFLTERRIDISISHWYYSHVTHKQSKTTIRIHRPVEITSWIKASGRLKSVDRFNRPLRYRGNKDGCLSSLTGLGHQFRLKSIYD